MITIIDYNRSTKTLTYSENDVVKTIQYDQHLNDSSKEEFSLIEFAFHAITMTEIQLFDKSILTFSYQCFAENDEEIEFETYEQFVNKMLELDSVTDDEKNVLEQTLSMEKNATWNME